MSKLHRVKCWSHYFKDVAALNKPFEVRKDDRDYQEGDTLLLEEWDPNKEEYTGQCLLVEITYKLKGGQFGIEKGYCILGIKPKYQTSAVVIDRDELDKFLNMWDSNEIQPTNKGL